MRRLALLMAGLAAITLSACSSDRKTGEAAPGPTPVKIGKPQLREDHETVSVSGTITSPDEPANVSFLVSGKVIKVGPREGDYVRKGAVLASIDPTEYRLALAAASAQTEIARIAFERAEDEHRRMKMLYDSKSLAPNDYQKFKSACESAGRQYRQAAASEGLSRKRLADVLLSSPISGFVSKRSIEPGEMASAGQPVFEIVKLDPVEVTVGIPEIDIHLVHAGQKADITLSALPGKSFEGEVRLINVSADPGTRTFMTRIRIPNPEHILRIGMIAECRIRGDRIVRMITAPIEAIARDPQGATMVYVYDADRQRVYARRVATGALYDREIEIRQGLNTEESIVIAGQERLRDGVAVSPTTPETKEKRETAPDTGKQQ